MNKIFFNKIRKITQEASKEIAPSKKTTLYDMARIRYDEFLKRMKDSQTSNGYTRYIVELDLLKNLKEQAQIYASKTEIDDVDKKIAHVQKILSDDFGITFKP